MSPQYAAENSILGQEPTTNGLVPSEVEGFELEEEIGDVSLDKHESAFDDTDDRDDDFVEADCIGHDLGQDGGDDEVSSSTGATVAGLNIIPDGIDQVQFMDCTIRYAHRVSEIVEALSSEFELYGQKVKDREIDFANDLFHFRFWVYAHRLPKAEVKKRLIAATPPVVQWLLGHKQIHSADIRQYATEINKEHKGIRGCYGNFARYKKTTQEADYVGSSVDLWRRCREHARHIKKPGKGKLPKHYRVLSQSG
ncbi:hypothetical protein LTR84_004816 [Exophiala bonariae]|uniref:Uncharacterized protein n=1 Tax=Exophiala bonariae TaxID=1690606 RepID=A0AAV9NRV3_9EURO|nr:hypothetical protein LTR84_004816 [Exophiala bonariae]